MSVGVKPPGAPDISLPSNDDEPPPSSLVTVSPPAIAERPLPSGSFWLELMIATVLLFGASLAGELLERYLFFAAVAAPRMPGGIR